MTSVFVQDIPLDVASSNGKRRVIVHIRGTSGAATTTQADTITDYVPNVGRIVGQMYNTVDGTISSTALTWSGVVLTYPDNIVAVTLENGIICDLT